MISKTGASKKSPYWIEKYRYLELKNFCLQYPIWKEALESLNGLNKRPIDLSLFEKTGHDVSPAEKCALARNYYIDRIETVEKSIMMTSSLLYPWILAGVTEGKTYDALKNEMNIPCDKDNYYHFYRKFFYILNKERD